MDIALLGDEDAVMGFKLAGVTHSFIARTESINEVAEKVKQARVLIITEGASEMLRKSMITIDGPIIIEIPDKSSDGKKSLRRISELFESTVGIKLKEDEN